MCYDEKNLSENFHHLFSSIKSNADDLEKEFGWEEGY